MLWPENDDDGVMLIETSGDVEQTLHQAIAGDDDDDVNCQLSGRRMKHLDHVSKSMQTLLMEIEENQCFLNAKKRDAELALSLMNTDPKKMNPEEQAAYYERNRPYIESCEFVARMEKLLHSSSSESDTDDSNSSLELSDYDSSSADEYMIRPTKASDRYEMSDQDWAAILEERQKKKDYRRAVKLRAIQIKKNLKYKKRRERLETTVSTTSSDSDIDTRIIDLNIDDAISDNESDNNPDLLLL